MTVATFDTLPLVAVTFASIVNVTTPPFGKVGIAKPFVDSIFAMVRFAAVGQTAPPVALQAMVDFVSPVATGSLKIAPSAAFGPALVTTIV